MCLIPGSEPALFRLGCASGEECFLKNECGRARRRVTSFQISQKMQNSRQVPHWRFRLARPCGCLFRSISLDLQLFLDARASRCRRGILACSRTYGYDDLARLM